MKSCCDEYCSTHGCNQGRDCPVRIERIRRAKEELDREAGGWDRFDRIIEVAVCLLTALIVVGSVTQALGVLQ